ncbi:tRNA (cytidine(34)-2'-O)-methyltransferase [Leptolyngbya sp. BC1307]|uniref:tRNA (cytidine(34)-2'-O)-methyltransferase n=1 Tax=Leptolyngbya sp. BC1307 TaxID=2029589 RepID=UPI000EFCE2C0|nr:tRNA (cytidine(34)-2'-O)-methyltransferase [Leptolyngbya sp. BC1307]
MPQVVLVEPEIPPNTGNIARTCAATGTPLHLVRPLGFELSDRYLKRAGLDYWPYVDLHLHDSLADFWQHAQTEGGRLIGFSARGTHSYTHLTYRADDWLLFGCESQGLPPAAVERCDWLTTIPMNKQHVRSLNLSVSAAVGLFEALRQTGS